MSTAIPIACNLNALDADERARRALLAERLRARTHAVRDTATGYALQLPEEPAAAYDALELALLERRCCPFLQMDLTFDAGHGPVWFTLGGGPGVKAFLAASSLVAGESSCCP